ncbi:hypothetical protein VNO77_06740 [Canavalia gladiata]|uniref:Uncharacterized protein n=1 Tax=Canavalia gladiata TaxID=3824 RepID=A0AAN9MDK6_CANGL
MANPTQIRPWSRLASLRSAPTLESHTYIPHTQPSGTPSSIAPSFKPSQTRTTSTKSVSPTDQSQTQLQKLKFTNPMTFPPSKLKVNPENETKIKIPVEEETKTVLVKKTVEKPNVNDDGSLQKESRETQNKEKWVRTKENGTKVKGIETKVLGSEGSGIRVITIAGENRGAGMEIIQSQKKPFHRNQKMRTLYMNSNVQCVNNSMVFHAKCTHHDPGMHLTLSNKPFGDGQR